MIAVSLSNAKTVCCVRRLYKIGMHEKYSQEPPPSNFKCTFIIRGKEINAVMILTGKLALDI
jgi:hypothetical protein